MASKFKIRVFGKTGCDKCKVLNQRIDGLLEKAEWADFQKEYVDVETEEGLVHFAQSECINPQRIPAFMVARMNEENSRLEPILNPRPGEADEVCKKSRLYTWLGLQTDYSEAGRGVISTPMITTILEEARRT